MAGKNKKDVPYIKAPYNFIPFNNKVKNAIVYENVDDENLPGLDNIDDNKYSGYVDFDIKNLTEISINQGLNSKKQTFYKNADGKYMIPGATLRGFIRTHCEILSFSYPRFISDQTFTYRDIAGQGASRLEYQKKLLKKKDDGNFTLNGVNAGKIYKILEHGTVQWKIRPLNKFKNSGKTYFSVKEKNTPKKSLEPNHALFDKEKVKGKKYQPYRDNSVSFSYDEQKKEVSFKGNTKYEGQLMNSAKMFKKNHHYLIPLPDKDEEKEEAFNVEQKMINRYVDDFEENLIKRNPNSKGQNKEAIKQYYQLPKEYGEENGKIFFYKRVKGDDENFSLLGFGATPYIRIFYDHSVTDGIPYENPDPDGKSSKEHEPITLNYVDSLFGFTSKFEALKGRLSFRDAVIDEKPKTSSTNVVLSEPKGTSYQLYLEQHTTNNKKLDTYNADFQLRGFKFYWKQRDANKVLTGNGNEKTQSVLNCIEKGHHFKARVYFNNLYEDELGLLLCAIQFKKADDKRHETFMIGKGKPYGFGKIEINDVKLHVYDTENQFTSLNANEVDDDFDLEYFKDVYKETIADQITKSDKTKTSADKIVNETFDIYQKYAFSGDMDDYLYGYGDSPYMELSDFKSKRPLDDAETLIKKYNH